MSLGPQRIRDRDAWPDILSIVLSCDGTRYSVRVDDDIVTVHVCASGLVSTTQANRARGWAMRTARAVAKVRAYTKHGES